MFGCVILQVWWVCVYIRMYKFVCMYIYIYIIYMHVMPEFQTKPALKLGGDFKDS